MTTLRTAAQQALEALEAMNPYPASKEDQRANALAALRAALAQQEEPVQVAERERIASQWDGCVTHQLDTFGPVNIGASIRAGELVEAQQDEPVEPAAQFNLNTMPGQADAHLRALLRYTENFYATAIEHGMRAGPTANAIAHVERAGKALHQIVHAQAKMLEPARPVEPVEPVAWECEAGGLKPLTQRQYDAQTAATKRHYTRIAPPQRKPLTEEEIERIGMTHQSLRQVVRAAERAHGIKE